MRWIGIVITTLFFAGCGLGHINPQIFPKKGGEAEIKCGNNIDLCLERAEFKCGYTGYKLLSKQKSKNGWSIRVRCNR